ncbi:MAG: DNA gyrase subunit A, partial [Actinomycetota bacterium]|nr:DNA gyrase subunit A [Actinomycetota bacterium]
TAEDLIKVVPGPDFPTGGMIMGYQGIRDAYETGRGSITIRGKAHIEQTSTGRTRIIVTEIPYTVNKSKMVSKIADLVREKKLTEISDLRDESDRKGMRVVIELKQTCIPQVVLNKLYKHTQLQTGFGVNMLALHQGVPHTMTLKQMLVHYIEHQKDVIVRRTRYELRKAEERAHILDGYVIALDNIDEVIKIIRGSQTDVEAKERLMGRFGLSEAQTDAILEMRLRRLTGLERHKIEDEIAELREKITYYTKVLGDINLVLQIIKDELAEVRQKFADKRRTQITAATKDLDVEDLIAEEDMVVTITQAGYVKRLPVATYRQQKRGGKGLSGVNLRENDYVEHLFISSTHDYVLFFSSKGKVYR